jgi:hypothetical protein
MNINKYPIYIISKGRWESRLTAKSLEAMAVPYSIVIEPQEYDAYASVIDKSKIKVLPFSNLGLGSIPARNWVWDDAMASGHKKHWILDDNIKGFYRLNNNKRIPTTNGGCFAAIEDFSDRFSNLALCGMQYYMFAVTTFTRKRGLPPFLLNTRIYSCILINHDFNQRWRGKYNEDTDLSLRALKNNWCTALFYTFLCDKQATLTMKGGNTDELYAKTTNRYEFAKSLKDQHPDVVEIVKKYGRWHHKVDYRPFKNNKLKLKPGVVIPTGNNEYGMKLVKKE